MNNIEIEIKVEVDESSFNSIKSRIKKEAKFIKESSQIDEYFTPIHRNFLQQDYPFEWLSLRERDSKTILNYKYWHPKNSPVSTHCDEYEVELSDSKNIRKIFRAINLNSLIKVIKKREVYKYNNEFEIAFDIIEELGFFIEIEVIKDYKSIEIANKHLLEFAKEMNIDLSRRNYKGYPLLLIEKKELIENKELINA